MRVEELFLFSLSLIKGQSQFFTVTLHTSVRYELQWSAGLTEDRLVCIMFKQ